MKAHGLQRRDSNGPGDHALAEKVSDGSTKAPSNGSSQNLRYRIQYLRLMTLTREWVLTVAAAVKMYWRVPST